MMKKDLMRSKDFGDIFETLESYPRRVNDVDAKALIQTAEMPKYKIK